MRSCVWMCAVSYQCFCNPALPLHCLMQRSLGESPPFDLAFRALLDSFWQGSCSRALRCAVCNGIACIGVWFGWVGFGEGPFCWEGNVLRHGALSFGEQSTIRGVIKAGLLASKPPIPAVAFCPLLRGFVSSSACLQPKPLS